MDRHEAAKFVKEQVQGRFGKWQPSRAELGDWLEAAQPYTWDTAQQSIRLHKQDSRLTYPILADFIRECKKCMTASRAKNPVEKANTGPVLLYTIQSESNPKLAFRFYVPKKIPLFERSILIAARENQRRHEQLYGQHFRIIRDFDKLDCVTPEMSN